MEKTHGVSVVVCCYNSVTRLPGTLECLANQKMPPDVHWEVLLINNASTDNTASYAKERWESFHTSSVDFRVINEPQAGQMYARKKGVLEAKYECIVFCDDDNQLREDYIRFASEMIHNDPKIGAGGGQNFPVTNAPAYPEWFDEYKDKYALGIPAEKSGDVTYRGFVLGAGLVTRKSAFLKVNSDRYPSLLNGRNGELLTTGDDFEYCKRLVLSGYKLQYDSRMILDHFIPAERLTIEYRDRLMQGIFEAGKILGKYDLMLQLYHKVKNKSRWRLLMLAPMRIFFSRLGLSKRNLNYEKQVFNYLSPFSIKDDHIQTQIKKFIQHK